MAQKAKATESPEKEARPGVWEFRSQPPSRDFGLRAQGGGDESLE